jgi:hypothetical protein
LLAGGFTTAAWLHLGLPRPVCPLKHWTGLPCLTCGSTRLAEALLRGDLREAAAWNPLVFGALAAAAAWAAASTVRAALGLPAPRLSGRVDRRALAVAAVAAAILGWAYLIWRGV